MPTGADVTGTSSILLSFCLFAPLLCCSLYLHLWVCFSFCPCIFALTRWRDALLRTFLAQDYNALSHVIQTAISSLSLSLPLPFLSTTAHSTSFSVSFPPDKARQRPFISPSLLVFSVFVLYKTRLPHSLCSLPVFAKKVSRGRGGPSSETRGLPQLGEGSWQRWEGSVW